MQVSVETTTGLGRRMTVQIPAEQIDQQVQSKLQQLAHTVRLDGFRPGGNYRARPRFSIPFWFHRHLHRGTSKRGASGPQEGARLLKTSRRGYEEDLSARGSP